MYVWSSQARMQRVREGAVSPPPQKKKGKLTKIEKKEGKNNKIKKIDPNYQNVVYKWVKSDEFSRG